MAARAEPSIEPFGVKALRYPKASDYDLSLRDIKYERSDSKVDASLPSYATKVHGEIRNRAL
jgi:hypothetical protein